MTSPKEPDDEWTFVSELREKYQPPLASVAANYVSKPEVAKMLAI